ncbi:MAG: sulfatase-like hydrolase/transferase [Proteobacteria bacterium]|nr:sulfatase-like hydrolase/transferase [Pseudomonadota bacterium]
MKLFGPWQRSLALVALLLPGCDRSPERIGADDSVKVESHAVFGPVIEPFGPRSDVPTMEHPNVLLIVADDMGVDKVGIYGEGKGNLPVTSQIDALAEGGILFRNAWANPVCSPTRAGIYTGRHAFRTGVGTAIANSDTTTLPLSEYTLPEILNGVDYRSGLFGKWHLGRKHSAVDHGFDTHLGSLGGTLVNFDGDGDYFEYVYAVDGMELMPTVDGALGSNSYYATYETGHDAYHWIVAQEVQNHTWFAVVSFNAPHDPWHVPDSTVCDFNIDETASPEIEMFNAMTECMDQTIESLLQALGDDILEDTIILFAGDNGSHEDVVQPPFIRSRPKGTLYEGGVNVPLIVTNGYSLVHGVEDPRSGPMQILNPGREVEHLVHTVDIFSTICEVAGVHPGLCASGTDSVSLGGYFVDASVALRDVVYTERFSDGQIQRAARNYRYKLMYSDVDGVEDEEFYDLYLDEWEEEDLLEEPSPLNAVQQSNYNVLAAWL